MRWLDTSIILCKLYVSHTDTQKKKIQWQKVAQTLEPALFTTATANNFSSLVSVFLLKLHSKISWCKACLTFFHSCLAFSSEERQSVSHWVLTRANAAVSESLDELLENYLSFHCKRSDSLRMQKGISKVTNGAYITVFLFTHKRA